MGAVTPLEKTFVSSASRRTTRFHLVENDTFVLNTRFNWGRVIVNKNNHLQH